MNTLCKTQPTVTFSNGMYTTVAVEERSKLALRHWIMNSCQLYFTLLCLRLRLTVTYTWVNVRDLQRFLYGDHLFVYLVFPAVVKRKPAAFLKPIVPLPLTLVSFLSFLSLKEIYCFFFLVSIRDYSNWNSFLQLYVVQRKLCLADFQLLSRMIQVHHH